MSSSPKVLFGFCERLYLKRRLRQLKRDLDDAVFDDNVSHREIIRLKRHITQTEQSIKWCRHRERQQRWIDWYGRLL